jgi:hypothetical protein
MAAPHDLPLDHVERLLDSAMICTMDVPYARPADGRVRRGRQVEQDDRCYIRPLIYLGYGALASISRAAGAHDGRLLRVGRVPR